jgi:hypothetical protein
MPRQPDQLDVALAFPLQAAARRNAIEIAVNVYLEQRRRMIGVPPFFQKVVWLITIAVAVPLKTVGYGPLNGTGSPPMFLSGRHSAARITRLASA